MSAIPAPLYQLLCSSLLWHLGQAKEAAFKALQTSAQLLLHFNPELELTLACEISADGI